MKVVFCSSEVFPFAKSGGLGDVCGSLPLALSKIGIEVAIVMPGYGCVGKSGYPMEQVTETVSRTKLGDNIQVHFIEHEDYFGRDGLYGYASGDYPDNIDRFGFYCDQVLRLLKQIDFQPDVIHCHDWQTALIPVYIKEKYGEDAFYARTKTIMTIHNLAFQGVFPRVQYPKLDVEGSFAAQSFEFYDQINLLKAGIIYSDKVTTVSPQYAKEIQTKQFGCGLEGILGARYDGVTGILNGLDHDIWNPRTDDIIAAQYSADDFDDAKLTNKMQLQKELYLDVRDDVPLLGFVGRLSHQKGLDLIIATLEDLVKMDVQMVFLGLGNGHYQEKLKQMAALYSDNIAVCFDFNEPLSHQIYAGSDLFLMPSQFEPCGLSQMISLYYGTIPVVFKTGGLADTVKPFGPLNKDGNGFVFTDHSNAAYLKVIQKAIKVFRNEKEFHRLRSNAFRCDFSWEKSACVYQEIYHNVEKQ
ncbi:MAG: glycogen synthase GlgA [Candidatus Omnitrophica bacterium]|nr:glycogen synthase GlgA [Candidatus Omnitrophota bacterium]